MKDTHINIYIYIERERRDLLKLVSSAAKSLGNMIVCSKVKTIL